MLCNGAPYIGIKERYIGLKSRTVKYVDRELQIGNTVHTTVSEIHVFPALGVEFTKKTSSVVPDYSVFL